MSDVRDVLFVAKLLGVAPYRRAGSGQLQLSRWAQALGGLLLAAAAAANSLPIFLTFAAASDDGPSRGGVRTHAFLLGIFLSTCDGAILLATLLGWQHRGALQLLQSPTLQRAWLSRPALPYLVGGSSMLMSLLLWVRWGAEAAVTLQGRELVLQQVHMVGVMVMSVAGAANAGLLAVMLSGVTRSVQGINGELQAVTQSGTRVTAAWVRELRRSYMEAVHLTEHISSCFGVSLLANLFESLWWVILHVFQLSAGDNSPFTAVAVLLRIVLTWGFLSYGGEALTRQGSRVRLNLHNLVNFRNFCVDTEKEIQEFSNQVWQEPLVFCCCNTINLNLRLFFQSAGIVVTYVVILLQFQDAQGKCS